MTTSVDTTELAATIATLIETIQVASSALSSSGVDGEDMQLVAEQAQRARDTVGELERHLASPGSGAGDEQSVLLHRLNNQLTGILSLAMLQKDDVGPAHPAAPALERIAAAARAAAAAIKRISATLKSAR